MLAAVERIRLRARDARQEVASETDVVAEVRRLPPRCASRAFSGRSPSTSSWPTSPSSIIGGAGGGATERKVGSRGSPFVPHSTVFRTPAPARPRLRAQPAVSLELVLTAHPTEPTRRATLAAHLRLSELLGRLEGGEDVEWELAEEITFLWQSDEVRPARPRVIDEIRQLLWFFEHSLIDAAEQALGEVRAWLPSAPCPLRFGSWVGGDADGNPATGADTIEEAVERSRTLILTRYRDDVRELARSLAVSSRLVGVSEDLEASLRADEQQLPEYLSEIGRRNAEEPYRRKLSFIWRRLVNMLESRDEAGFVSAAELARDLEVLDRSLRQNRGERIADGGLARLRRRVEIFGFHLARLDIRLHARDLRRSRRPGSGDRASRGAGTSGTAARRWDRSSCPERAAPGCARGLRSRFGADPARPALRDDSRSAGCAERGGGPARGSACCS